MLIVKVIGFLKKEISGWKFYEAVFLLGIVLFILISSFFTEDNVIATCSAIFGILYTFIAGKGKIICYLFGLLGSSCYAWLSAKNLLYGNMLLYLLYYIPMEILGIFRWRKHLNNNSIEKIRLSKKERLKYLLIAIFGSTLMVLLLRVFFNSDQAIDGITTFLSILGMLFTVKRCIEQWIIWIIVNGLSFIMWLNLVINGTKAYSTVIMWGVYFILAIYFYVIWEKEIDNKKSRL